MDTDLGFGFLLFRGILPPAPLSLKSNLGPCRGYTVRRCLLVFACVAPNAKVDFFCFALPFIQPVWR